MTCPYCGAPEGEKHASDCCVDLVETRAEFNENLWWNVGRWAELGMRPTVHVVSNPPAPTAHWDHWKANKDLS